MQALKLKLEEKEREADEYKHKCQELTAKVWRLKIILIKLKLPTLYNYDCSCSSGQVAVRRELHSCVGAEGAHRADVTRGEVGETAEEEGRRERVR